MIRKSANWKWQIVYVIVLQFCCGTNVLAAKNVRPTFQERRQKYIDQTLKSSSRNSYTELVRLTMGIKPDEDKIRSDVFPKMNSRGDTADFRLPAILFILNNFR